MDEIALSLAPLFEQAEREELWFYCRYQDLWFSPSELKQMQSEGRFRWGAPNWELRDPHDREIELLQKIQSAKKEYEKFVTRWRWTRDESVEIV